MNKINKIISNIPAHFKDKVFLQFKNQKIFYKDLPQKLEMLSKKIPLIPGKRVLIMLPDSILTVLVHLECFRRKDILIPVSQFLTSIQLSYICSLVKPHLIITTELLYKKNESVFTNYCILLFNLNNYENYEIINNNKLSRSNNSYNKITNDFLSLIMFTSGTTGKPKGVCLSFNNILSAIDINIRILSLNVDRNSLVTVPLYDYYGLIQIYSHLFTFASFIIGESGIFPKSAFKVIEESSVTDIILVPFTLKKFIDFIDSNISGNIKHVWQNIKYIASSSDALTSELLKKVFSYNEKLKIYNVYGLIEAGRAVFKEIKLDMQICNSIGKPSPGMNIRIDSKNNSPGEIIINGPTVMVGYMNGIDNNDNISYIPIKEIYTGDEGYYDTNGDIILIGRKDHIINIKGYKLHPGEIEQLVLQLPFITDVLARSSLNESGDTIIELDVVPTNQEIILTDITNYLKDKILHFFIPQKINIVNKIERTELGNKIIRS